MSPQASEQGRPPKKSILIVDDHPVLRRGLAALIDSELDLAVCGESDSVEDSLEVIEKRNPDLVIVDLMLGAGDGMQLIKEMKSLHPQIPALVLSMHNESVYAERCLRAGARGYVTKQQLDDTVLIAIRHVLDGGIYISNKLEAQFANKFLNGQTLESDSPVQALSDRELQVFSRIGQGYSTREIAKNLNLSVKTIESHVEHIKSKLTITSATELTHRATEWVESEAQGT